MIFERVSCLFTLSWLFTFCLTCRNGLTYTMQVGYWDLMWKIMIFLEFQLFVYFQLIVYFLPYLQKWTHLYIITLARESIGPLPSCYLLTRRLTSSQSEPKYYFMYYARSTAFGCHSQSRNLDWTGSRRRLKGTIALQTWSLGNENRKVGTAGHSRAFMAV